MEQTLSRRVRTGDVIKIMDGNGNKVAEVVFDDSRKGKPMLHTWSSLGGHIEHVKAAEIDAAKSAV